jgi:hypothetical protein
MLRAGALLIPVALLGLGAGEARAEYVIASPVSVEVESTPVQVTIEFVGSDTPTTGTLYLLGDDRGSGLMPSADSGTPGLGQQLFTNSIASPGDTFVLPGVFDATSVLHFAYEIEALDDVFRTDVPVDSVQFAFDPQTMTLGVDDNRFPNTDIDYNDMQVNIVMAAVPAPASVALLGLAFCRRSRRRRA